MSKWNEYPLAAVMLRMARGAALGAVLLTPMKLSGQEYDPADLAILPHWCKYTQSFSPIIPGGMDQVERDRWYQRLGPTFHHMHHYCKGLIATNQARRAPHKQLRMHLLRTSINEFDYVLERAPQDFVLLPEILTKKGENLIKLDQGHLGVVELQRAVAAKPDYWPPYAALSDRFKAAGDIATAREWLEKGLAASPNIKALQNRLAELGEAKGKSKRATKSVEPTKQPKPPAAEISPAPAENTATRPSAERKP